MNLCANAAHAMRARGGVLLVGLSRVRISDLGCRLSENQPCPGNAATSGEPGGVPRPISALKPGPHIRLAVSDTGHGIDPGVMDRIFDPYFTTKGTGEGTGLGLSTVQGIVRTYGGAITAHSEPGKGTTFEVFFPGMDTHMPARTENIEALPAGAERIMLVEDETILAELGKEVLESLGYQVVSKTNSLEALETFRADTHGFDLVITDMTMPDLRGDELAREITALRPGMPIVLCTGCSEHIDETQARQMGIRELVMKPYMVAHLAKTIRKALQTETNRSLEA